MHESRKLNLVAPEKSNNFSYAIKKVASPHGTTRASFPTTFAIGLFIK